MTNTERFYQHLDRKIPLIQRYASAMTKDFDTARFLYQETLHQAIKNKHELQEDIPEAWVKNILKKVYCNIVQRDRKVKSLSLSL